MAVHHIDRLDMLWLEFIALNELEDLGKPADEAVVKVAEAALVMSPKVAKGHTRDSIATDGSVPQLGDIICLAMYAGRWMRLSCSMWLGMDSDLCLNFHMNE